MATVAEPITRKTEMYRLVKAGRLGNYPRMWDTVAEVENDKNVGLVSIRSLERSSPVKLYHIPAADLRRVVADLPAIHIKAGLTFLEAPPDHLRTVQGEWDGHNLFYSFRPEPMRTALEKDGKQVSGLTARLILKQHLDPIDVEWLDELTEQYPDHVIEFSGFRVRCGTLQRRMIVWEVRAY